MKRHIPNIITCLNLISGSVGCIFIFDGRVDVAVYFVILAGFFDFCDGFFARLLKVSSPIGKELDSLADMVSFGVLPAFFMYRSIAAGDSTGYLPWIALIIVVFSAVRLARFNLDERQTDGFIGLPTPANALMLTSIVFLPATLELPSGGLALLAVAASCLLVAPMPMIALKFSGTSWQRNSGKYVLIAGIALLISIFGLKAAPFVIPLYILISLIRNFRSKAGVSN